MTNRADRRRRKKIAREHPAKPIRRKFSIEVDPNVAFLSKEAPAQIPADQTLRFTVNGNRYDVRIQGNDLSIRTLDGDLQIQPSMSNVIYVKTSKFVP